MLKESGKFGDESIDGYDGYEMEYMIVVIVNGYPNVSEWVNV